MLKSGASGSVLARFSASARAVAPSRFPDQGVPMFSSLRKRRNWTVLLVIALGALPAHADKPSKRRDNVSPRLFPMKVGHKWVYAFEDKEVTFEVLRTEKLGEEERFVVRRTIEKLSVDFKISV